MRSRREFHRVAIAAAVTGTTGVAMSADEKPKSTEPTEAPFVRDYPAPKFLPAWKKPQLNRLLVQDFVIFAHSEFDMVKKLLEKEPALLNATIDWGGGDWETGLGGASHLGNREIAEYLISKGARIDLFAATMLGHLDVVKSLLASHPSSIDAKGPHGIPLLMHARMGGKPAEAVLDFLTKLKPPAVK